MGSGIFKTIRIHMFSIIFNTSELSDTFIHSLPCGWLVVGWVGGGLDGLGPQRNGLAEAVLAETPLAEPVLAEAVRLNRSG